MTVHPTQTPEMSQSQPQKTDKLLDIASLLSVPILDQTIPPSSSNFTALQWMPFRVYADAIMGFDGAEALGGLPVPEPTSALSIA